MSLVYWKQFEDKMKIECEGWK